MCAGLISRQKLIERFCSFWYLHKTGYGELCFAKCNKCNFLGNARKTAKDNIFEKKITLNQEDQHKNFV